MRFWVRKKIHWSDTDAAGIAWFPTFFGWFEDAEEEVFAAVLGRTRQSLLDEHRFGMPRVEVSAKYKSPVRAGQQIRIGIRCTLENARRLHHDFEMRDETTATVVAEGFVRVACVDLATFVPRDFPAPVLDLVTALPLAAERQQRGEIPMPWT
ncbi:MAG: acyl-CoA thioesterase [Acidobacteriota bacterium]